jgi:hypothetical protein
MTKQPVRNKPSKKADAYERYARKLRAFRRNEDMAAGPLIAEFEKVVDAYEDFKRVRGRQTFNALRLKDGTTQADFARFMAKFNARDTDHPFMKFADQFDKLRHVASLRVSLSQRTRRKLTGGIKSCPEFMLQSKAYGYQFADLIGVKRPHVSAQPKHVDEIEIKPGFALKPPSGSGSQGVYLIFAADRCLDVFTGTMLTSLDAVRAAMRADVAEKRVPAPNWNAEQLIQDSRNAGGVSHDWKFYCFYGEVHRIGYIQRYPEHRENWFDGEGRASTGAKTKIPTDPEMMGDRIPADLCALAKKISLEIPAPFIRIDFLSSDDGYYLGEFTARPGTIHMLDRETDRKLGDTFIKAAACLEADLMAGKPFAAYKKFFANRKKRARSLPTRVINKIKAVFRKIFKG